MANSIEAPHSPHTGPAAELADIAQMARTACGARGCLIAWRAPPGEGSVWAASGVSPRCFSGALIPGLISHWSNGAAADGDLDRAERVTSSDLVVLRSIGVEIADSARIALYRRAQAQSTVGMALIDAAAETAALAALTLRCAAALIDDAHHSSQAAFWRVHAGQLRDNLVAARIEATAPARQHALQASSSRGLIAKARREDLAGLASHLSRLANCKGWIVAASGGEGLCITKASGVPREALTPGPEFERALRRRAIIQRNLDRARALSVNERQWRRLGYRASICVPLGSAAIMLLAREPLRADVRAGFIKQAALLEPYLRCAFLTRELERQRVLVRSLVRGLFATADAERANLRRDLHDDWAQLLAAAQIAINGNRAAARRFFRQLETELRKRLDALRPSQPSGGLRAALEAETRRLRQAGIDAAVSIRDLKRLPGTIREVVRRVIGEGVSNVIRHAGADRVRIEIECRGGVAMVAVIDNGRGAKRAIASGSGLRGLSERVAMLGGRCDIDSDSGGTRLCARIPVADL